MQNRDEEDIEGSEEADEPLQKQEVEHGEVEPRGEEEEEHGIGDEEAADGAAPQSRPPPRPRAAPSSSTAAPLSSSSLSSFHDSLSSTGLLYFSRLPPHLKPAKLRQLLSSYGVLLRIYLTPERSDQTRARARARSGGGSGGGSVSSSSVRRYVDGWVEFEDKKVAKAVALTLNGTAMGGRKRGFWYDDLWSVRYLKGFKWNHLTEKTAYERQLREGRRREEVGRAKKESDRFTQLVDKGRRIRQMEQRKETGKRKTMEEEGEEEGLREGQRPSAEGPRRVLRAFYQRPVVASKALDDS